MNTSMIIAYIDLIIAPLLLISLLSRQAETLPPFVKLGGFVVCLGLFAQSIIVLTGTNQLEGIGTFWALKDIGVAIIVARLYIGVTFNVLEKTWKN